MRLNKAGSRPELIIEAQTERSLARLAPGQAPQVDLSAAGMLSQLHSMAGMLLQEVQLSDAPVEKRLAMAKDLAKLLPLLATAERKVFKGWGKKDVEDMTDRELMQARRALKKRGQDARR